MSSNLNAILRLWLPTLSVLFLPVLSVIALDACLSGCNQKVVAPSVKEPYQPFNDRIFGSNENSQYVIANGRAAVYVLSGHYEGWGISLLPGEEYSLLGKRVFRIKDLLDQHPKIRSLRTNNEEARQEKALSRFLPKVSDDGQRKIH